MKKRMIVLLTILTLMFLLTGCSKTTYQEAINKNNVEDFANGYFTAITEWNDEYGIYRIVYANDTKVKYMILTSGYKFGITPLYNEDGTLQIYDGK